ncbi:MAG: aldehyde dehydrogenase family protein [Candidatus Micrarchaeia archaeon]
MVEKFKNEFTYRSYVESNREEEFDNLFDKAIKSVEANLGKRYPICIDGKEVYASEEIVEKSPINHEIILGRFQKADRALAEDAISAAKNAFTSWSETDYMERVAIFRKAAELFSKNKFTLAAILSYENGKSRYESIGEVDEAIDFLNYYSLELEKNKGYARKLVLPGTKNITAGFQGSPSPEEKISISMKPYGVFGVIAPFNFPVSISVGMSSGALITGNTVVFKPSSTDNMSMLTGYYIYKLFEQAGLPHGVFNYITGPGNEIGDELVSSNKVSGIVFTGSRATGLGMISKVFSAGRQKVFVVEMGGKNPAIVSNYADLDAAAAGVASAAFGFAGQKCSALSRVYVQESIKELFVSKLISKLHEFKIGNPLDKSVYLGPLISEQAYKRYVESVSQAKKEGTILYGGSRVNTGLDGYYVEPTIAELRHGSELVHKELFIPFLAVVSYKDFDSALAMANDTEYGLTAGLYSKNKEEIKKFTEKIEAGVVYINREASATTGAIVGYHAFVGWKGSGLTGKGTGSKFYLEQFMHEKSIAIAKS